MTKEIIEITSRDQWLAERTRDITSTEAVNSSTLPRVEPDLDVVGRRASRN